MWNSMVILMITTCKGVRFISARTKQGTDAETYEKLLACTLVKINENFLTAYKKQNKNAFQSNANHPLADSMGYIKLHRKEDIFTLTSHVTLTLMCDFDLINDL